jgi:hypothetical protein
MKQIIIENFFRHSPAEEFFAVPMVKVRRMANIRTETRIIRPVKGGGYSRKEKFDKGLTSDAQSV